MPESRIALTDELLGAYADGELDALLREAIEGQLALDAESRRRLSAIREVNRIVRAASSERTSHAVRRGDDISHAQARHEIDVSGDEDGPGLARARKRGSQARTWLDWRVAASFVMGALLVLSVIELGGGLDGAAADWRENALAFHDMYVRARANGPPDAMLDIVTSRPDELAQISSFPLSMPDLTVHGYEPAVAHLIPSPQGPIVYVVFENGERPPIGFAMTPNHGGWTGEDVSIPAMYASRNGVNLVSWSTEFFDYGIGGQLPTSELLPLADTARGTLPTGAH